MFTLTKEEIDALTKSTDPQIAAAAQKLKKAEEDGEFIPKSRLSDALKEKKTAEDRIAQIEAEKKKKEQEDAQASGDFKKLLEDEKKAREQDKIAHEQLRAQLEAEKKEADQMRAYRKSTIESVRKQMGDKWLPEYESFSLESLAKLPGVTLPKIGVETGAAAQVDPPKTDYKTMEQKDFQKQVEAAKRGELVVKQ